MKRVTIGQRRAQVRAVQELQQLDDDISLLQSGGTAAQVRGVVLRLARRQRAIIKLLEREILDG